MTPGQDSGSIEDGVRWLWGLDEARRDGAVPPIESAVILEELHRRLETSSRGIEGDQAFWRDAALVGLVGWPLWAGGTEARDHSEVDGDASDVWSALPTPMDLLGTLCERHARTQEPLRARYAMLLLDLGSRAPHVVRDLGLDVTVIRKELQSAVDVALSRADHEEAALLLRGLFVAPPTWLESALSIVKNALTKSVNGNWRAWSEQVRQGLATGGVEVDVVLLPKAAGQDSYLGIELGDPRSDTTIQIRESLQGMLVVEVFKGGHKETNLPVAEVIGGGSRNDGR